MATQGLDSKTRDRIVEAAGVVFAEKGYESATVREICSQANANLAAVNYYFGDKHSLYVEAIRRAHTWRMDRAPIPNWSPETPPAEKLRDFIRALLTRMLDERGASWHAELMLREMFRADSDCEEMVGGYIRPQFEVLQAILAELTPRDVTPEQRRLIAFSVVGQCLYYRVAGKVVRMLVAPNEFGGYSIERLAEHIANFSLAALGVQPALNASGGAR